MYNVPNKDAMKYEIMPHLSLAKRGQVSNRGRAEVIPMRFPQPENRLLMADYFCVFMMLFPLSVGSMPHKRSRWPLQAYMHFVPLHTRSCLPHICFV